MSIIRIFLVSAVLVSACVACSPEAKPDPITGLVNEPVEKSNADNTATKQAPIVQVRQTLNLSPEQSLQAVAQILRARSIGISSLDEKAGVVETDWIETRDYLCQGHKTHHAPLSCRARLSLKVEPYEKNHSALHVKYQQFCSMNEDIPNECPGSDIEKLMLSILEDMKTVDSNVSHS